MLWFAVVGTLWNSIGIGVSLFAICQIETFGVQDINLQENLLFASIISAVDPLAVLSVFEDMSVNEVLYIVVFGECLFNDAITVVSVLLCLLPFRKVPRDSLQRAGSFSCPPTLVLKAPSAAITDYRTLSQTHLSLPWDSIE